VLLSLKGVSSLVLLQVEPVGSCWLLVVWDDAGSRIVKLGEGLADNEHCGLGGEPWPWFFLLVAIRSVNIAACRT